MGISPTFLAAVQNDLFDAEQTDRDAGLLSPDESWVNTHFRVTMLQTSIGPRTTQVHFLVEHTYCHDGLMETNQEVVVGEARRDPKDRRDDATGLLLATTRAMEKVTASLARQANGRVKHADDMKVQRKRQKQMRAFKSAPPRDVDKPEVEIPKKKKTGVFKKKNVTRNAELTNA